MLQHSVHSYVFIHVSSIKIGSRSNVQIIAHFWTTTDVTKLMDFR
jgi:hypothetical protein